MAHRLRHTVRTENQDAAGRHVGQVFDEHRALLAQVVHHELVVHHFVAHIDGRAMQLDGTLHDFECAIDAGTEAARIGKQYVHLVLLVRAMPYAFLRKLSSTSRAAPTEMAESATLNAAK